MAETAIEVSRDQVLTFRRDRGGLHERRAAGASSWAAAAHLGLTDSSPRAAVLQLHARVEDVPVDVLDDPALVQVWGPRHSVYVVAADDVAVFTLGRLPTDARRRGRAEDLADRLRVELADGQPRPFGDVGRALGVDHNALRYAAPLGILQLCWDGARQPTVRLVDPPEMDERDARHELLRRYLQVMGPATPGGFARWAGVSSGQARATFDDLATELVGVHTPIGSAWVLAADVAGLRAGPLGDGAVRLLPSGDPFWLLWGDDRDLVVPDPVRRDQLWTPRVWPGALLVGTEVVGTWRRAGATVSIEAWSTLSAATRAAAEVEATTMPLPGLDGPIEVRWSSSSAT